MIPWVQFEIGTIKVFFFAIRDSLPCTSCFLWGDLSQHKNVHMIEEFPMLETFTDICIFCGLVGHYRCFIKEFTDIMRPLYDLLGKEVNCLHRYRKWWGSWRTKFSLQSAPMLGFQILTGCSCWRLETGCYAVLKARWQALSFCCLWKLHPYTGRKELPQAQEADTLLATCRKCLKVPKDTPSQKRDIYLGSQVDTEEGHALFHICNSLDLSKEWLYINTTPKGEVEVVLAFLVPSNKCTAALNGVHHDAGHQGQQRMLAMAQECLGGQWWQKIAKS